MRYKLFFLALSIIMGGYLSLINPAVLQAQIPIETSQNDLVLPDDFPEIIKSFRSDVVVHPDSSILVTETIVYDFHDNAKHGIYRDIPLTKVAGSNKNLKINDISVMDENGHEYTTAIKNEGGTVRIKVGDADKTITGEHTYKIYYIAKNAIGYFDDRDEIYWNITGNEWNVPIWEASAHVFIPGDLEVSKLHIASYCGPIYSKETCINGLPIYHPESKETEVVFNLDDNNYFESNEGMTVAVGFPKGIVALPITMWWEKPEVYVYGTYGIIGLFILFLIFWLFKFYFPEVNKRRQPIMAEYTPPEGISPSQAAYIYNGKTELSKTISAEILYLASLGYISITREDKSLSTTSGKMASLGKIAPLVIGLLIAFFATSGIFLIVVPIVLIYKWNDIKDYIYAIRHPSDFILTKNKNADVSKLSKHLSKLLSLVTNDDGTGKSLDDTEKDKDYYSFVEVNDGISDEINEQYPDIEKYNKKRNFALGTIPGVIICGFLFAFASFIGAATTQSVGYDIPGEALITLATFFLSIWLFLVIKSFLSARLYKMTAIWYKVAGLREYIDIAEKERLTFQNDPASSLKIYSTLLPYATAFGLEHKWSKVFDGIVIAPPEWYHSSTAWSASQFSSSLGAFSYAVDGTSRAGMPVSSGSSGSFSGSSGGGSSGGGGGGGGGGSW